MQRVDSGSTTRRATVHSLWSGLKIESPKTREGPRVMIFRPWLEKHGSSDAAAMVQLRKDAKELSRFRSMYSFLAEYRIKFPASCGASLRSEYDHAPQLSVFVCLLGFKSARILCIEYSCIGESSVHRSHSYYRHYVGTTIRSEGKSQKVRVDQYGNGVASAPGVKVVM